MKTVIAISISLLVFGVIFSLAFGLGTYNYLFNTHRNLFLAGTIGIGCGLIFIGFITLLSSFVGNYFQKKEFVIEETK